MKKQIIIYLTLLLLVGCRNEVQKPQPEVRVDRRGQYVMTETFEVKEGPNAGIAGSRSYTVQVGIDSALRSISFENLANAYTVAGAWSDDSVFLPQQRFPYYTDFITISGRGTFRSDSLFLEFIAGGPPGQIHSSCKAKKLP